MFPITPIMKRSTRGTVAWRWNGSKPVYQLLSRTYEMGCIMVTMITTASEELRFYASEASQWIEKATNCSVWKLYSMSNIAKSVSKLWTRCWYDWGTYRLLAIGVLKRHDNGRNQTRWLWRFKPTNATRNAYICPMSDRQETFLVCQFNKVDFDKRQQAKWRGPSALARCRETENCCWHLRMYFMVPRNLWLFPYATASGSWTYHSSFSVVASKYVKCVQCETGTVTYGKAPPHSLDGAGEAK